MRHLLYTNSTKLWTRWAFVAPNAASAGGPSDAANDLLDQVLAEPSGQWAHAQLQAVINRSEDRVVQYFRPRIRSQLTFILASPQIIVSDYTTLMVEILKDNPRPVAGEVYAAVDISWAKHVGHLAQAYEK